jgi:hypothetical protein
VYATGAGICEHAGRYYDAAITGEPPIFWISDESVLGAGFRLEQQRFASGDDCHFNIHGVSDAHYKRLLKSKRIVDFLICGGGIPRAFGTRRLARLASGREKHAVSFWRL